ncbi:sugar fermentation stimulation protein A [Pyrodictium occultum]|uniref:Sugar fermentation stimulation protein A n=1 Tax=Pyrodictium occultum TaxID=2309 RepID=A0A0V8RTH4_PYROC|nr:DNA/RNA nuclease SfsA [Pyrodictium occultum]KSW11381.1 sugar fermentation stimulation protein A [Pyrodictium occultum]
MSIVLQVDNLIECRLLRRVNRFVVEAEAGGERILAHNTNTGRLADVLAPGRRALCIPARRPGKTRLRLIAVEYNGGYAVVDTRLQEDAFAAAVDKGLVPWAAGCRVASRRPRLGGSVLDFLLRCPAGEVYVESKSAVLMGPGGLAMYPDCPTERGRRHIRELIEHARRGVRAALVFIAALPGARGFAPNPEGDPEIPGLVEEAVKAGVIVKALGLNFDAERRGVRLYAPDLPVVLRRPRDSRSHRGLLRG